MISAATWNKWRETTDVFYLIESKRQREETDVTDRDRMRTSLGRRRETTDVSILLNLKAGARKLT